MAVDQCCELENGQHLPFMAQLVCMEAGELNYSSLVTVSLAMLVAWRDWVKQVLLWRLIVFLWIFFCLYILQLMGTISNFADNSKQFVLHRCGMFYLFGPFLGLFPFGSLLPLAFLFSDPRKIKFYILIINIGQNPVDSLHNFLSCVKQKNRESENCHWLFWNWNFESLTQKDNG